MKRSRRKATKPRAVAAPASMKSEFPSRLRSAREERRLSQTELERITGISQAVIANYEAGRYRPGFREMLKLCDALRVAPNVFFYGKDDPFTQRDLTSGEIDAGFQLWEGDTPPSAELLEAVMRGTAYLIALDVGDRRAVFDLVQSLVRKKLKPGELQLLETFATALAQAFVEQGAKFEHEIEKMVAHPTLKRFTRKPRRSK